MPRVCKVCTHPDREEIAAALVRGASPYSPKSLLKAQEVKEVARADSLLNQIRGYQDHVDRLTHKAEAAGDFRTALSGLREARGYLELLAKVVGELDDGTPVNIINAPQFVEFQTLVIEALEEYPEAGEALVARLAKLAG